MLNRKFFESLNRSALIILLATSSMFELKIAQAQEKSLDQQANSVCSSILNQNVNRLQDEKIQNLCQYSGKRYYGGACRE